MRDRLMLEHPEKMCEYCCNFDKEHIGMDGTALCKLTMTLAYSEDYGGNCMFYNVPKERIIVQPCKVGDIAYHLTNTDTLEEFGISEIFEGKVCSISKEEETLWIFVRYDNGLNFWYTEKDIGKNLFLTKEEAEKALMERSAK